MYTTAVYLCTLLAGTLVLGITAQQGSLGREAGQLQPQVRTTCICSAKLPWHPAG